jgi:hypothetical protein
MTTKKTLKQRTVRLLTLKREGDRCSSQRRLYISTTGTWKVNSLECSSLKDAQEKFNMFLKDSMSRGYNVQ